VYAPGGSRRAEQGSETEHAGDPPGRGDRKGLVLREDRVVVGVVPGLEVSEHLMAEQITPRRRPGRPVRALNDG
jgi:hypothetical protein